MRKTYPTDEHAIRREIACRQVRHDLGGIGGMRHDRWHGIRFPSQSIRSRRTGKSRRAIALTPYGTKHLAVATSNFLAFHLPLNQDGVRGQVRPRH